jgi:hypothetical protein
MDEKLGFEGTDVVDGQLDVLGMCVGIPGPDRLG